MEARAGIEPACGVCSPLRNLARPVAEGMGEAAPAVNASPPATIDHGGGRGLA